LYNHVDHIFVHTEKMKEELYKDYKVKEGKTTVIPYPLNTTVPAVRWIQKG